MDRPSAGSSSTPWKVSSPTSSRHHRLEAAKMLRDYGSEVADEYIRNYTAPKPRRSTAAEGSPAQGEARPEHEPALSLSKDRRAEGRDPIIDPIKDEMARFIREETNNGQSIVRNLIQIMEAREDPYKPNHNLDAARQLTDNGFPVTGDLLCATECSHHAPDPPSPSFRRRPESRGAGSGSDRRRHRPRPRLARDPPRDQAHGGRGPNRQSGLRPFQARVRLGAPKKRSCPTPTKLPPRSGTSLTFAPSDAPAGPKSKSAGARSTPKSTLLTQTTTPKTTRHIIRTMYDRTCPKQARITPGARASRPHHPELARIILGARASRPHPFVLSQIQCGPPTNLGQTLNHHEC